MLVLTYNAVLRCSHVTGVVRNQTSQEWVRIRQPGAGDDAVERPTPLLIEPDPEGRRIVDCPNINIGILPCGKTLSVREGYSTFVRIGGHPICLKSIVGLTDGSPGVHEYRVTSAGQSFVTCTA
jgi:hypothetical protein